jgi:hypothetical protein
MVPDFTISMFELQVTVCNTTNFLIDTEAAYSAFSEFTDTPCHLPPSTIIGVGGQSLKVL